MICTPHQAMVPVSMPSHHRQGQVHMTSSHFFPFKAFLRATIALKRPFHRNSLGTSVFVYRAFHAKEQMKKPRIGLTFYIDSFR